MLYDVSHTIQYEYGAPAALGPHVVRLLPRTDGAQRLLDLRWDVRPKPAGVARVLDAQGNDALRIWFEGETRGLVIRLRCQVETLRENPFDCPSSDGPLPVVPQGADGLNAFRADPGLKDAGLLAFLEEVKTEAGTAGAFPTVLCRRIFESFEKESRDEGAARAPEETWALKKGACRDLSVLYMALARQMGFAARFVSGYHDNGAGQRRDLHAWVEIYTDQGGWRGHDPSTGLATALHHIAVAVGASPADAAPVSGTFGGGASSKLKFAVSLSRLH